MVQAAPAMPGAIAEAGAGSRRMGAMPAPQKPGTKLAPGPETSRRKVTIFDVAERAGVSIKTVSRVVNNEANVREKTREKVLGVVRELQYKPNAAARELSGRRSRTIGLVYENAEEFNYTSAVLNGALGACEARGYSLLLCPLNLPNPDIGERVRGFATQARVEGIVLPAPVGDVVEVTGALKDMRIPFAAIAPRDPLPAEINIGCKDEQATFSLTEYLIGQGHRSIGYIKGHPEHGASAKRFSGYRRALEKHGLAIAPGLVRQGYFDFDSGKTCAAELLDLPEPPTAIVAGNDDMAAGVLFEARERGLPLPGRLSVVGFDDTRIASRLWPPLTTVRQPILQMAETAARLLIGRLNGEAMDAPQEPFDCEVVIRESAVPLTGIVPSEC